MANQMSPVVQGNIVPSQRLISPVSGQMPPGFPGNPQGDAKKKLSIPNWLIFVIILVVIGIVGLVIWLT